MKKIILTALVAVIAMVNVNAQESTFRLGASAGYSSEIEEIGFGIDAVYSFNETWEAAADYYMISADGGNVNDFDVNLHYMFSESFYALAGANFSTLKTDAFSIEGFDIPSFSVSETGANVGLGGRFGLSDSLSFFTEAKYVTSYDGLFNIKAGILFSF